MSVMKHVNHGVPQGSVIGPLMYTIYINKLSTLLEDDISCEDDSHDQSSEYLFPLNCRKCIIVPCYADDTTVVVASKYRPENQQKLLETMRTMKKILNSNQLTMNEAKTTIVEVMVPKKKVKIRGSPPIWIQLTNMGELKRIQAGKYTRILGYNLQKKPDYELPPN